MTVFIAFNLYYSQRSLKQIQGSRLQIVQVVRLRTVTP